jgi:hypothetical protein
MAVGVYVNVTEPLADSLARDGFRQAGIKRGIDPGWALAAGANLVTIFIGRHEIAQFVGRLWAAARGRPAIRTHDSMVVIEDGDRRVAITLEHEGFGEDGPPQAVLRGMTSLLEALAELEEDRPAAIPRSGP